MNILKNWLTIVLILPFSLTTLLASELDGRWITQDEEAQIEISEENGVIFGSIVWLKEPLVPQDAPEGGVPGEEKKDIHNPDPKLRDRTVLGLKIVDGFRPDEKKSGHWSGGTIYDGRAGKTYRCHLTLRKDGKLKVRGFIGVSLLGRTDIWTRVP